MQSGHTRQVFTSLLLLLLCVTEYVPEVSRFCEVQEVKKVGVAGLSETVKSGL